MLTILKTMVAQIDVLETMTQVSFLSFRSFLANSSGFQSAQFREWEFMLGHKRPAPLKNYPEDYPEHAALERRLAEPSICNRLLHALRRAGIAVPTEATDVAIDAPTTACPALQPALVAMYRDQPGLRGLCELFVDLDEGVQEWRYRHVKMVERTIGFKRGTGGSPGVPYLRETLFRSLPHASEVLEHWQQDYNEHRPHSKLGWMTPRDYALALMGEAGRRAALRQGSAPRPLGNHPTQGSNQPRALPIAG